MTAKNQVLNDALSRLEGWGLERDIIEDAMDEYAKQQAIAFLKWAMESALCGDNYKSVFIINEAETEETLYSQFTEQQKA